MIHNLDRSYYFGASDCKYVMAKNRDTASWKRWWSTKLGESEPVQLHSKEIEAGNKYEKPILLAINENMFLDGQIVMEDLRIRVNYDGWCDSVIYEIKTHHAEKEFEITNDYWMQCQLEMFVYKEKYKQWFLPPFRSLYLVSYGLNPDEYDVPWDKVEIDPNRLKYHPVKPDKAWIKGEYLPKVRELARALKKGKFPG